MSCVGGVRFVTLHCSHYKKQILKIRSTNVITTYFVLNLTAIHYLTVAKMHSSGLQT